MAVMLFVSIANMSRADVNNYNAEVPSFIVKRMLSAGTLYLGSSSWPDTVAQLQPGATIRLSSAPFYAVLSKQDTFVITCTDTGVATVNASFSTKDGIADCVECFLYEGVPLQTMFTNDNQCVMTGNPSASVSLYWLVDIDYNGSLEANTLLKTRRVDVTWRVSINDLMQLINDARRSIIE